VIESVSEATGQLMLRETPTPIELSALVPGTIVDTDGQSWVDIDAEVCLVQGIVGLGGEAHGVLKRKSEAPGAPLEAEAVTADDEDAILFSGGPVTGEALRMMAEIGVRGVVAASASGVDLMRFTKNRLNPASTGPDDAPLTLVLTEGFGALAMTETTFQLLSRLDGKPVSISGVTQVRAGVIRPEVVAAPLEGDENAVEQKDAVETNDRVRIIRGASFGKTGRIRSIPKELVQIKTGAKALVYDVELESGRTLRVPRQNVELLGGE
jgi:hypothetical protein